jgi:hypothetical protein
VDEAKLSLDAVQADMRAAGAAGGFRRIRFDSTVEGAPAGCRLIGVVRTDGAPQQKSVAKVVAELKARRWKQEWQMKEGGGTAWALRRADWDVTLTAGTASEQSIAAALPEGRKDQAEEFSGLIFYGAHLRCRPATPTASP